ncbi:hypothetical protein PENSPDRAFT_648199 [Peniophora sp. CONT]|nr:hypothetical protein PENSPDRAFT_648199 [Peniophora sp. CONT]
MCGIDLETHRKTLVEDLRFGASSGRQSSRDLAKMKFVPPTFLELEHMQRVNTRSVMQEMCRSVHELKDYKSLLLCLIGVTSALSFMRKAGWVHRDVSGDNCMYYEGRGILADLEYDKSYGELSASDPKTGTPDFMAVEYQTKEYLFLPLQPNDPNAPELRFIPNPAHDLESVVWQYLWFLHYRTPCDLPAQEDLSDALQEILRSTHDLFTHGIRGNTRRQTFMTSNNNTHRNRLMKALRLIHTPPLVCPYDLIYDLRNEYVRIESQPVVSDVNGMRRFPLSIFLPDATPSTPDIYATFKKSFAEALNLIDKGEVLIFTVEDSSYLRERLARKQNGASAPPDSSTASGSRRSLRTPVGNYRGSDNKRSPADAQLDDEEVGSEKVKPSRPKKAKSAEQSKQAGTQRQLRSVTKGSGAKPSTSKPARKTAASGSEVSSEEEAMRRNRRV